MQHAVHHRVGRPRATRAADTRDRILKIARDAFSELGYDATAFQEIAVRADLTRPAINHYFPSKKVLYEAILGDAIGLVGAAAEEAWRETGLIERLSAFVAAVAPPDDDGRAAVAFVVGVMLDAHRHPDLSPLVGELQAGAHEFFRGVLSDAVATGELTTAADLPSLVGTLSAVVWGIGFYVAFVGDRAQAAAVIANVRLLLANELWRIAPPHPTETVNS